jgi:hypothetical protein
MHADVELSLEVLRKSVALIAGWREDRRRLLAHILAFGRLLQSDRVLKHALQDLRGDPFERDAAQLDQFERELLKQVEDCFLELGHAYRDRHSPWRKIVDRRNDVIGRARTQESLAAILERVATPFGQRESANLTREDGIRFLEQLPKLTSEIANVSDGSLQPVSVHLEKIRVLAEQLRRLDGFVKLTQGAASAIVERLGERVREWEARLQAGPASADWNVPETEGLEHDIPILAARIEQALNGRRSLRLVLFRAKVFFEHFYCIEARAAVELEEARVRKADAEGDSAQAQRERGLRRHFDRTIFQDGFFPITEASAARGRLDLLLAAADGAGIRPLVAEIKQAVRINPDNIKAADVRKAVDAARGAISKYAGHLRSRPGWESIEPIVVVFHTSIEDVSALEDEATILIDIGKNSPSRVSAPTDGKP